MGDTQTVEAHPIGLSAVTDAFESLYTTLTDGMGITQMRSGWCVYVLECAYNSALPGDPKFMQVAETAPRRFYVGSTNHLERRMNEHLGGDNGAMFTRRFPPTKLKELEFCEDEYEARDRETGLANELRGLHPEVFVYQA